VMLLDGTGRVVANARARDLQRLATVVWNA
jgi:hypothetical protein